MHEVKHFVKVSQYFAFLVMNHEKYGDLLARFKDRPWSPEILKHQENIQAYLDFLQQEYYRTEYYMLMELETIEIPNVTAKEFYLFMITQVKTKLTFH